MFGIRTAKEPSFEIIKTESDISIRDYSAYILAVTSVSNEDPDPKRTAFFRLFNYISGYNVTNSKITMTAPVLQEQTGTNIEMTAPVFQESEHNETSQAAELTMSFVLPANMKFSEAPNPKDPFVKLIEVPAKRVAVLSFSGSLSESNLRPNIQKLKEWITEKGYTAISKERVAGYDPPFTIPFLRRNEIHIDLK